MNVGGQGASQALPWHSVTPTGKHPSPEKFSTIPSPKHPHCRKVTTGVATVTMVPLTPFDLWIDSWDFTCGGRGVFLNL